MVSRKKQYAVPFSLTIAMAVLLTGLGLVGACSKASANATVYLSVPTIAQYLSTSSFEWTYVAYMDSGSYINSTSDTGFPTTSNGSPESSLVTITGIGTGITLPTPTFVASLSSPSYNTWSEYSSPLNTASNSPGGSPTTIPLMGTSISWTYTGGSDLAYTSLPSYNNTSYYEIGTFSFVSPTNEETYGTYLTGDYNTTSPASYEGYTHSTFVPAPVSGLQTVLIGLLLGGGLLWKLRRRNSLRLA